MRLFQLHDKTTGDINFAGLEASRSRRCPVCGHDSWCLIDAARGLTICPRTISARRIGEAGYLHGNEADGRKLARVAESVQRPRPPFNAAIAQRLQRAITPEQIEACAADLGVSPQSLRDLDIGWDPQRGAFGFPMRDPRRLIIGVRLRRPDGFKFAVENSRNGLFYPTLKHSGPVYLPEGPTDTAALLTMGLDAIGRPFCRGSIEALCEVFDSIKRPAVVVADQDQAGIEGAHATADALAGIAKWVKVIRPPKGIKDSRAWLHAGGTRDSVTWRVDQQALFTREEVA